MFIDEEIEMANKDKESQKKEACTSCGDDRVALTEEKDSPPRCAGCGKVLPKEKK